MINFSYVIIGMLIAEISMVFWIFRWALKAVQRIRISLIETLIEDTDERNTIVATIATEIWKKLNGFLNLNQVERTPENIRSLLKNFPESGGQNPDASVAHIAKSLGIDDPSFLKYLPAIKKFMEGGGNNNTGESVSMSDETW